MSILFVAACAARAPVQQGVGPTPAESHRGTIEAKEAASRSPNSGVISAAHPLAADAGQSILRQGGSAFDAAVAAALVLGVVNPQSSGLGGGGFAVFRTSDGKVESLDFRETAPSFFTKDTYLQEGRSPQRGAWAVGIPGEAAGLAELHLRGGVLPWNEVVEPARLLASEGFTVGEDLAAALKRHAESVLSDEGLAADFAPQGRVLNAGERCVREALGETLAYLGGHGGLALYQGPLARRLAGFVRDKGAPWTEGELSGYGTRTRPVITGEYAGHTIHTMGPPSSGGIALVQTLALLAARNHGSAEGQGLSWSRTLVGALAHSFADRAAYGGDPDFAEVPAAELLDPELPAALWRQTPSRGPAPREAVGLAGLRGETAGLVQDDSGTSHLSAIDAQGQAIALTTTINLEFGALIADPSTGIVLNDELDDFAARPGIPNAFGLVQGVANAPAAGKRPLSSMSPSLVLDDQGRVVMAVGAAGGPRIITATLQTILGVLDRMESISAAVAAPRLHHQWLPASILFEPGISAAVIAAMKAEGFAVDTYERPAVVHAVGQNADGTWQGGADPRASGAVRFVP